MTTLRSSILVGALGLGLAGTLTGDVSRLKVTTADSAGVARWTEVAWPFLLDQWGRGRAFRCGADVCGIAVDVYLRAKVGFCNCTTGVADDEEIDRVADYDLLGGRVAALGPGRPIQVGWMNGRERAFQVDQRGAHRHMVTVALSNRCDALTATIVSDHEIGPGVEGAALELLNGRTVLAWVEASTGQQ